MIEYNLQLIDETRQLVSQAIKLIKEIDEKLQQNRLQDIPHLSDQYENIMNEIQVKLLIRESLYGY